MRGSCSIVSLWWPVAAAAICLTLMGMVPEVAATRYIVGGNKGWSPGNNYTEWAADKHFHADDWLFFVYDRNQQNILEVNKTDYEACNSDHPLHNWTTGAGRDVVPLNVTRHFYFLSGKGFCFSGMKLAVHVEKAPPPPTASPVKNDASVHVEKAPPPPTASPVKNDASVHVEKAPPPPTASPVKNDASVHLEKAPPPPTTSPVKNDASSSRFALTRHFVVPAVFAVGAMWDSLLRVL